jgi:hypothetical protein
MTTKIRTIGVLTVCVLAHSVAIQAAEVVYNNSTPSGNQFLPNTVQYGDEITLGGSARTITQFQFEYYFSGAGDSSKTFGFNLYANDGDTVVAGRSAFAPSTLLYSTSANLQSGFNTVTISGISVNVPDTVTWTVSFSGLGVGEEAGLLLGGPTPSVGASFNDFWEFDGSVWSLKQINGGAPVANFIARVEAVPEPGTILTMLGGLAVLGVAAYRRRVA